MKTNLLKQMSQNWSQANYGISGEAVSVGNATIQSMSNEVMANAPQMEIFNGYESTTFNPSICLFVVKL
jgi:hypothetical protein